MQRLLALVLLLAPAALATLQISSVTVPADGVNVAVTLNGAYTSGATTNCFTVTGGNTTSNTISTITPTGGSAVVALAMAAPLYKTDAVNVALAASPGCAMTGSTGAAAASNANAGNLSEWRAAADATMQANCRYNAFALISAANGYPNSVSWNTGGGSIECNATGSEIDIWTFGYTSNWASWQDNVRIPCPGNCVTQNPTDINKGISNYLTATTASTIFLKTQLATGLSGTHLYRIAANFGQNARANGGQLILLNAIRFVGGDVTGTKPAGVLPVIEEVGESNSGVGGGAPVDEFQYTHGLLSWASPLGVAVQYGAAAGQLVASVKTVPANMVNYVGGIPLIGVIFEGANDASAHTPIPSYTSDFIILLCNMMNIAACGDINLNTTPPTYLFVRGLANTLGNQTGPYNTAMQSAIATVNSAQGTNIRYFQSQSWISQTPFGCPGDAPPGTNDIALDTLHFCGALALGGKGFGAFANNEAPIYAGPILGSSYTVSCGAAQRLHPTTCTVSLLGGGSFYGAANGEALTFAPSDNGIICANGTCMSGAVTIVNPSSGTSYTFTYTPVNAGTTTLVHSNNIGAWTSPANTSVTVSAFTPTWTWQ